jgi:hypothetical protein
MSRFRHDPTERKGAPLAFWWRHSRSATIYGLDRRFTMSPLEGVANAGITRTCGGVVEVL